MGVGKLRKSFVSTVDKISWGRASSSKDLSYTGNGPQNRARPANCLRSWEKIYCAMGGGMWQTTAADT